MVDDAEWLRSSILLWDKLSVPWYAGGKEPFQSFDAKLCRDQDTIKILKIEDFKSEFDSFSIASFVVSQAFYAALDKFQSSDLPEDVTPKWESVRIDISLRATSPEWRDLPKDAFVEAVRRELSNLFAAELPNELGSLLEFHLQDPTRLRDRGRKKGSKSLPELASGEPMHRMVVDKELADAFVAAVACRLADHIGLSPVTSSERGLEIAGRRRLAELVDESRPTSKAAFVTFGCRTLRIDPSTPIEKVLSFRAQRADQYLDYSNEMANFIKEIDELARDNSSNYIKHISASYQTRILPNMRKLRRELDRSFIQSLWDGAYRAVTLTVPAASALAVFTGMSGQHLLGAGAALLIGDLSIRSKLASDKARDGSAYSYLLDAKRDFGLPPLD